MQNSSAQQLELIDVERHYKVFFWILEVLRDQGLLKGKTMGIDATTLEANAAMRSVVRRDTGESYEDFLKGLAKESGIETPTREDLARLDRTRENKASNADWVNPHDGDARITKMKDGRTHLAHKAEHAVDCRSGAVLAVTLHGADEGDTATLLETLAQAGENVAKLIATVEPSSKPKAHLKGIEEVVGVKGYHAGNLTRLQSVEGGLIFLRRSSPAGDTGKIRPNSSRPPTRIGDGFRNLWQAATAQARRVARAEFRALLRYRRDEKDASAKTREHSQAIADSRWSIQSEFDLSLVFGLGYPAS